eukprot:COSAG01_NODE_14237_length_1479_cov_1.105797_1_plen_38_part_10
MRTRVAVTGWAKATRLPASVTCCKAVRVESKKNFTEAE